MKRFPSSSVVSSIIPAIVWFRTCSAALIRWFAAPNVRHLIIVLSIGIAFGGYFVMRYGGYWAEHDSFFFVQATNELLDYGRTFYPNAYPHGYAYPTWMASMALLTGLEPGELTRFYTPVLGSLLIALMSYVAFVRFLGKRRHGLLATTTIFFIPELVFTASRGNHEKIFIALALLASLATLRSFKELQRRTPRWNVYAGWTLLYYLGTFGMLSDSFIFGLAVLGAWTVTLVLISFLTLGRTPATRAQLRLASLRMRPMIWSSWILMFLIAWYVYPPMKQDITHIRNSVGNILELLSGSSGAESAPYAAISLDWVNQRVYNALTAFRWLLFIGSGLGALFLGVRLIWKPGVIRIERVILLGLFLTFGFELAAGIAADFAGLGFGDNLQVRFFTYYGLFAAPMFVLSTDWLLTRLRRWLPLPALRTGVTVLILYFALTSLLKATLDPLVSNNWIYYHPNEIEAINTWAEHSERRSLFLGNEARLWAAWVMTEQIRLPNNNFPNTGRFTPQTAHVFSSRIKDAQANTGWTYLPPITEQNRVYDNGEAWIYHRIPLTPLQQ